MKNYCYQRAEYSNISTDKDGKTTGNKSVVTCKSDENGNLKELKQEKFNLNNKGEWEIVNDGSGLYTKDAKLSKDGKHVHVTVTDEKPEPVQGKFKDGDILKAEYSDRNVYAAYKNDTTAYWALVTSLTPGKNNLYGADGVEVKFDEYGFNFDDFDRVTRDEVFAVERFIQQNTGFRWDWRNKIMVKD